jgi:hypothetical protein
MTGPCDSVTCGTIDRSVTYSSSYDTALDFGPVLLQDFV